MDLLRLSFFAGGRERRLHQPEKWRNGAVFALFAVLLISGCKPRPIVLDDDFAPSNRNPQEILDLVDSPDIPISGLTGRARAQYSGPGVSDRSTVSFSSDRDRTLLIFRNNLGIEGARLLVEPDSVTLYNRIDQTAQRIGTSKQDVLLDYGFYAVNLLNVLNPDFENRTPRRVLENDTSWQIIFLDNSRMVFDKSSGLLKKIEFQTQSSFDFSSYLFDNHVRIDNYWLPRSIQILSRDKKSSIFLNIQSFEVNPPLPRLTLDIPSHVRIDRQ